MNAPIADPRPANAAATAWVQSLLENLTEAQLGAPTPCGDLDVRAMARHLHATLLQARAIAETGSAAGQPVSVEEFDASTFATRRSAALAAWESAPLDRAVTVPWGTAPAVSALGMYVNEAPRAEAGPTERLANWNGRIPSSRAAEDVVSH
jgi:hypothetical protein